VMVKDEQYLAIVVHPHAKISAEMQEIAGILDLEVDHESLEPSVFEVVSGKEGWIQSTFANATPVQIDPSTACVDEFEMLPAPLDVQAGAPQRKDIVVSTRSLLEVMFYLSQAVDIPVEHQAQGIATVTVDEAGAPFDWSEMMQDLFAIHACEHRPTHAAVAVKYRDFWFYIDERDQISLSTYSLLVELFGIEVRAGGGGGFLYTLGI
jgi:hypothetical protein